LFPGNHGKGEAEGLRLFRVSRLWKRGVAQALASLMRKLQYSKDFSGMHG
jgi:hypothetical protein